MRPTADGLCAQKGELRPGSIRGSFRIVEGVEVGVFRSHFLGFRWSELIRVALLHNPVGDDDHSFVYRVGLQGRFPK